MFSNPQRRPFRFLTSQSTPLKDKVPLVDRHRSHLHRFHRPSPTRPPSHRSRSGVPTRQTRVGRRRTWGSSPRSKTLSLPRRRSELRSSQFPSVLNSGWTLLGKGCVWQWSSTWTCRSRHHQTGSRPQTRSSSSSSHRRRQDRGTRREVSHEAFRGLV